MLHWCPLSAADLLGRSETAKQTRPWEAWELDERFFQALSQWTSNNPEMTIDRVLDKIRDGLENSKDLLGLIPDSPFPARGLVTALAYLLRLGVVSFFIGRRAELRTVTDHPLVYTPRAKGRAGICRGCCTVGWASEISI